MVRKNSVRSVALPTCSPPGSPGCVLGTDCKSVAGQSVEKGKAFPDNDPVASTKVIPMGPNKDKPPVREGAFYNVGRCIL